MNVLYLFYFESNSPEPWQILSWKVAVITGLSLAILALINAIISLFQRAKDIRWKQAELARKLIDELFKFKPAHNALIMIDEFSETFRISKEEIIQVRFADIDNALTTPVKDHSNGAKYIRRCFDALFFNLERIEQSIQIKVVKFEDVRRPAEYYVERFALHKKYLEGYINFTRYSGVESFLNRFPVWKNSK